MITLPGPCALRCCIGLADQADGAGIRIQKTQAADPTIARPVFTGFMYSDFHEMAQILQTT
ncbi:hypothetical protein [Pollutimonas sp. M17]|uniref:hypothetical protein n=1 Tax=Pollutimonas sp. M17 TaxID=2962065 RepID=UPI0021F495C1|nr:hypothetical protein [Pollutimonas sp. M17]UYO92188.1 hypothetical protein OEG81_09610 [Pollutimonas sp. M17]